MQDRVRPLFSDSHTNQMMSPTPWRSLLSRSLRSTAIGTFSNLAILYSRNRLVGPLRSTATDSSISFLASYVRAVNLACRSWPIPLLHVGTGDCKAAREDTCNMRGPSVASVCGWVRQRLGPMVGKAERRECGSAEYEVLIPGCLPVGSGGGLSIY